MKLLIGINEILFADYKIRQRHELLARTIGAKQEEEASLSASNTLVITATIAMIVVSILEVALYRLYNRKVDYSKILYSIYNIPQARRYSWGH